MLTRICVCTFVYIVYLTHTKKVHWKKKANVCYFTSHDKEKYIITPSALTKIIKNLRNIWFLRFKETVNKQYFSFTSSFRNRFRVAFTVHYSVFSVRSIWFQKAINSYVNNFIFNKICLTDKHAKLTILTLTYYLI